LFISDIDNHVPTSSRRKNEGYEAYLYPTNGYNDIDFKGVVRLNTYPIYEGTIGRVQVEYDRFSVFSNEKFAMLA